MTIAVLVVGTTCLIVGGYSLARRDRVVARLTARPDAHNVQPPMAFAVMGVILGLAGIGLILSAIL